MPRRHETRFWMPPDMPGVSCLTASFTDQHFPPHAHDALVVAVTEEGGSRYTSRGRSDEATVAQLLVFNPTEPHAGHMRGSQRWRYRAWYFSSRALDDLARDTGRPRVPGFTTNAIGDPHLIAAFASAHRTLEHGDATAARERLVEACGRLFSAWGHDGVPPAGAAGHRPAVDRALARIREHFRDGISLRDLADEAGVSPFQLIRQFRHHTGMPPHAHLVRVRLHQAIARLRAGVPLADAAADAGFFDQPAMTRAFRRAYGITPGQYRHAVAAVVDARKVEHSSPHEPSGR